MNEVSDAAERHAEREVQAVLKSLLRNLTDVRTQRAASMPVDAHSLKEAAAQERVRGEIIGLDMAIAAVRRRIR